MRTSIFIPFVIAFGFISGCRKTEILPPETPIPCYSKLELIPIIDTCFEPLPPNNFGFLPVYFGQKILYQFPEFDPSENEQFLYFHGEQIQGSQIVDFQVKGASFCTGEIWTIIDSIQFSYYLHHLPKWSEKGWILLVRWEGFNVPGERGLYKIKYNGDSLKLLLRACLEGIGR